MNPAPPANAFRILRVGTSISLCLILRNQMRILAREGFEITCVCEPDRWARELWSEGFRIWPIGMGRRPGPAQLAAWSLRFFWALKRHPVHVVHTHNAYHGVAGRLIARLAGVPVVVQTIHNWHYLSPPTSRRARLYRLLERIATRACDMVFFLNQDDLHHAAVTGLVPTEKRRFIGNGIDVTAFSSQLQQADRASTRAALGLNQDDVVITMVARLEAPKDHHTFLRAFNRVRDRVPRARALLVGYGLRRAHIEAQVRCLGLESHVQMLGYRQDVAALLKASDLLVLTTAQEGVARSLIEGMLASLPVVTSDVVGARDTVCHGRTGLLVPPGDDASLAATLLRLVDDPALAEQLGQAARAYALEHFDERPVALRVGQAYRELLARRGIVMGCPGSVAAQP